jgi:hypothetical protein
MELIMNDEAEVGLPEGDVLADRAAQDSSLA